MINATVMLGNDCFTFSALTAADVLRIRSELLGRTEPAKEKSKADKAEAKKPTAEPTAESPTPIVSSSSDSSSTALPPADEPAEVTYEAVYAAVMKLVTTKGKPAAEKTLRDFGALLNDKPSAKALKPEQYADFLTVVAAELEA